MLAVFVARLWSGAPFTDRGSSFDRATRARLDRMRTYLITGTALASMLLLGGCQACTAVGGFDGIMLAVSAPKVDGAHTVRIELDGDKAKDSQFAEFMCDFEAVEDPNPELPAFRIRCDLVDGSKGLEDSAYLDTGEVPRDSDEARYSFWIFDIRSEQLEVQLTSNNGTDLAGSVPDVQYGDRYYPNGKECDDEGYRSAEVELELELM